MSFGSNPDDPMSWADATGHNDASDAVGAGGGGGGAEGGETAADDSSDSDSTDPGVCSPDSGCPCSHAQITSETIMTEPPDRTRTTVGVGERTTLTYSLGDATWTCSAGDRYLSSTSGASVVFRATPLPNASVTITATGGGCSATITFTVIPPNQVRMLPYERLHQQNTHKVGMHTNIFFKPDTVNFHRVEYLEDEVMCNANGVYACINNTGHGPNANPLPATTHVAHGYGTQIDAFDEIKSGYCNFGTTQGDGHIQWDIPWRYRVRGYTDYHRFDLVHQICTSATSGRLTASKAGGSVWIMFADPGTGYTD